MSGATVAKAANDNHHAMTFISMFSGIEAASVAFGPLGWKAVAFAEIEKFPSAVLAHHYPETPNVGDMTAHDWAQYAGKVDIVCGGPPCQAFSVAGLRNSMADPRGNLSLAYMGALHAIKPRNAIVENVPGWLNTSDNAFGCFLAGIVGADDALCSPDGTKWPNAGMVAGPLGRAAWRVLDAQHFGLAQRRRRVVLVADFGNGADPATVLFERKSMHGNPAPRRKEGEGIAPTISARTKGGGGLGTDFDLDGGVVVETYAIQERAVSENLDAGPQGKGYQPDLAYTLEARNKVQSVAHAPHLTGTLTATYGEQPGQDMIAEGMLAVCATGQIAHTLKGEGHDASEDGTGRGGAIVFGWQNAAAQGLSDSETLRAASHGALPMVAQTIASTAKDYGGDASTELAPTLRAGGFTGSHANGGVMPAVARTVAIRGRDGGATAELGGDKATALRASSGGGDKAHVLTSTVRRLTPVECERLMGFPDGYTDIPWRKKPTAPDGPRYKALGNSWAVPKFAWVGARIAEHMPKKDRT